MTVDFQAPSDFLRDRIILITGTTDGIGRQAAFTFASYGATIILLGRQVNKLEKIYDEIVTANFPQPAIYPLDLSVANPDHYQELSQRINEEFGRLDVLLHNAAILGKLTPIEHFDIKTWYNVMQTNLHAPFLLTKYALPLLRKSSQASLIFTVDQQGKQGHAYWGAYGAAKFALNGLMQIIADEIENTAVRVNAINPGMVRTKLRASAYPAENSEILVTPEKIMSAYLYLLSEEARHLHGQWIDV